MEERLQPIFKKIFKGRVEFSTELTRENLPMWDSLTHVRLCVAIENEFGIRFDGSDAVEMNTGDKILQVLQGKLV